MHVAVFFKRTERFKFESNYYYLRWSMGNIYVRRFYCFIDAPTDCNFHNKEPNTFEHLYLRGLLGVVKCGWATSTDLIPLSDSLNRLELLYDAFLRIS